MKVISSQENNANVFQEKIIRIAPKETPEGCATPFGKSQFGSNYGMETHCFKDSYIKIKNAKSNAPSESDKSTLAVSIKFNKNVSITADIHHKINIDGSARRMNSISKTIGIGKGEKTEKVSPFLTDRTFVVDKGANQA
jgi:hypothetical protein